MSPPILWPKLIGITGKAGTGKDTLASYLVAKHGYIQQAFATPLKQALNSMFGWDMSQWEDREWKETPLPVINKSPRYLAQTLGTEWGRGLVYPELWIYLSELKLLKPAVFSDVRFPNESEFIRKHNGLLVEIRRDVGHMSEHASENQQLDPYFVIYNVGSKEHLYETFESLLPGA